ncbi:MAG TPA: hypothetical protein VIM41_16765 [Gammaproteobacteria bacterium]
MTPIYRSPDHAQAKAIQSLLLDHSIQSSIIESKKSDKQYNSRTVIWYEIWLRFFSDVAPAKTIVTQYQFTGFKINMSSVSAAAAKAKDAEPVTPQIETDEITFAGTIDDGAEILLDDPPIAQKRRENLIPINNKRVFKRLGILLGYSEEQIEKFDSNKLYRPWDAGNLMQRVKDLKRKCS